MPLQIFNGPIIRAGQHLSDVLAITDQFIVGLVTPAAWTPARVTVQVSPQGDNYYDLFDGAGNEFAFSVIQPNTMIYVNAHRLMSAAFIRFRSGTRNAPVVQPITRNFFLIGAGKIALASSDDET